MDHTDANEEELVPLIALLGEQASADPQRRCAGWSAIAAEVTRQGSAFAVWNERHPLTLDGLGENHAALVGARDRLARWRAAGCEFVTVLNRRYPLPLRHIAPTPPLLFVTGELRADEVGVSVAGSREASAPGLANGIDAAAHQATLVAGGRPIGVLGTGITRVYPETNRALHARVAATGVLVSQFFPEHPPDRHTLAVRNATMAGLSRASVIVEAGERSGSRVHARYALAGSRPLIVTDAVVASTRWGREISHRPEVYMAGSAAEVLRFIDTVVCDVDAGT
jgi:DNA processing protein